MTAEEDGKYTGTTANDSMDRAAKGEMEGCEGMPVGVGVAALPFNDEVAMCVHTCTHLH